jgi:cytochrome P450
MSQEQLTPTNEANQVEIPSFPFPFADHSLDVPEEYDQLRQQCPVARVHMPYGGDAFLPTRYQEIAQAFAEPHCSMIPSNGDVPQMEAGQLTGTEGTGIEAIFAHSDARHTKLRRVIGPAFTVPAANKLRSRVVEVTHALVDAMERSGPPAEHSRPSWQSLTVIAILQLIIAVYGGVYVARKLDQRIVRGFVLLVGMTMTLAFVVVVNL